MSIILFEPVHPEAQAMLETYGDVVLLASPTNFDTVRQMPHVEALITRGRGQIRGELIRTLPDLRVVARCGVGLDNIDTAAAAELGIPVVYAPGSTTIAIAEHTLLLMLALARRLVPLDNAVKAGNWAIRNDYSGIELAGKTLGIIGMGAIGQRVAMLATVFGMPMIYWNRRPIAEWGEPVDLATLLRTADVVSLHVALTAQTTHLIGERELAWMKAEPLLINTARGALVDQQALQRAILRRQIGGYASDVLEAEPPVAADPLIASERSVITPHVAALTDATYRLICVSTCANVLKLLRRETPEPRAIFGKSVTTNPTLTLPKQGREP